MEDEGDEEGDHGSIVAFRIPCRPSVDFQPPSSCRYPPDSPCRLLQPADLLHPLVTRLLLSCLFGPSLRSCPPAASRSPLSLGRPYPPLLPPPPTPAPFHATRTKPSTLDRRRVLAPSTCTRRYAGPDPPTRHRTLFPPRSHVAPHPPSFHPFHPLVLRPRVGLAPSFARESHFRSGFPSLTLRHSLAVCLPVSRRYPSRRVGG